MTAIRSAWLRGGALAIGTAAAASANAQADPVPAPIVAQLERLREHWPEVAEAQMRSGRRFEYRDGIIRIGEVTLKELATAPENASGAVLAFLIGHEAWHSVQAARRKPDEFARMRDSGMLECEADFMGAAAAWRHLSPTSVGHALEEAHDGLISWLRTKAALAGAASNYPSPDERGWTAAIGWGQAASPALIRYVGREPPKDEAERAQETCRKIARMSDGSLGALQINWAMEPEPDNREPAKRTTVTYKMTAENRSPRPITANFLAPAWLSYYRPDELGTEARSQTERLAYDVLDVTVELAPKQKIDRLFEFRNWVWVKREDDYSYGSSVSPQRVAGRFSQMISSHYTTIEPRDYCIDRIRTTTVTSDRSLLARIAAVAMAANDDFEAIRSGRSYDDVYSSTFDMSPALAMSSNDTITSIFGSSSASMQVAQPDRDAAAIAEFARLKALLRQVCGPARVVELPKVANGDPDEGQVEIARFAPKVALRMDLFLARRMGQQYDGKPRTGGTISVTITRDPFG